MTALGRAEEGIDEMMGWQIAAEMFPGFALVLARLTGLFIFAPLLSSPIVPRQFKVLLAAGMAAAIFPMLHSAQVLPTRIDLYELVPLMAGELMIGLSIGVLASIPLMSAQLAGIIMGQQMGLGLASVYNPSIDFEGDSLGQILFFVALASYLAAGGLEAVYSTLLTTFERVPIGGFGIMDAPLDFLTAIVSSGFDVAVRMSMPVLAILFLETLAVGFIMKSVPSLNIMSFGFPLRIMLGTLMVISSLAIMIEVLMNEIGLDLERLREWAAAL